MIFKLIALTEISALIITAIKKIIKTAAEDQEEPLKQYIKIREYLVLLEEQRKRLDAIENIITKIESNAAGTDSTALDICLHGVDDIQLLVNSSSDILTTLYSERTSTRSIISKAVKELYAVTETVTETTA